MAEIEARREARRKKILENSEKRLNKISGVEQKSTSIDLDGIKKNAYLNDNSAHSKSNEIFENNIIRQDRITTNRYSDSLSEFQTSSPNVKSKDDTIYNYQVGNINRRFRNIHILLLPIILSCALVIFDLCQIDIRHVYLNKMFIPLLAYEIVQYFNDPLVDSSPNFVTSILLLITIKNRFITSYLGYVHYIFKLMQDVMVYFFVFTLSYGFFTFMLL